MVFSSFQPYPDPSNWQLLQRGGNGGDDGGENSHLPSLVPPPPTLRPSSMPERARLAKLPHPETALKCPRCESTNTKFCYFNNYSLTQPRHFCKTCRRYWTRGGALRNVPVGGGCRRNKRSKRSRSKSPVTVEPQSGNCTSTGAVSPNSCTTDMNLIGHLPFLPSLHPLTNYGAGDIGLSFGGIPIPVAATGGGSGGSYMEYQIGRSSSSTGEFTEQWRVQQFPFLAGLEQPSGTGTYQFEVEGRVDHVPSNYGQFGTKPLDSVVTDQLAAVKMEENQGLNLSKNFSGVPGNDQFWGGNAWTDLSGSIKEKSAYKDLKF